MKQTSKKEKQYITIRVTPQTHQNLRVLAALSGESLIDLLERLARQEREKRDRQRGAHYDQGGTA